MEAVALLSAFVTKAVDLVRGMIEKPDAPPRVPKVVWIMLSLVIGVAVSYAAEVETIGGVGNADVARIMTGLSIGGLASVGHEVFDATSGAAKFLHARATMIRRGMQ